MIVNMGYSLVAIHRHLLKKDDTKDFWGKEVDVLAERTQHTGIQ